MPPGGKRAGAGRPKGAKDSYPRDLRRRDVINARKAEWDEWDKSSGARRIIREKLLQRVQSDNITTSDLIKAMAILDDRALGKVDVQKEQVPSQPLMIVMQNEGGGWTSVSGVLPDPNVIEGESRAV